MSAKKVELNVLAMQDMPDEDTCIEACKEIARAALDAAMSKSGGNSARQMIGLAMAMCSFAVSLGIDREELAASIGETHDQYSDALSRVHQNPGAYGLHPEIQRHLNLRGASTLEDAAERLNSLADELELLRGKDKTKH